ncbi:hypothetical protein H9P43_000780 [Blastocladiella emersonii ATCC 22665]|nr:hypothetical protein H9P43_000780 [Blastocladiella emersonii ATCC 22665]
MATRDVQQLVKEFRVPLTDNGNARMNADDRDVARILIDVANRNHARITEISHGQEMYPPALPMDDDPPAPAGAPPLVFRHTRPRPAAALADPVRAVGFQIMPTPGNVVVAYTDGSYYADRPGPEGVARAGSAAVFPLPDGYDTATRHDADCRAAANGVTDDDVGHIAAAKLPPGPFSSTRAEIHAFVLAVSQVAAGTALHIYSDSQAAIEAARTQLSPTATMRQRVRCASSDLWSALRLALRDRNVKVTFSWVRGHADDPTTPNNIADRAAKAAANQPPASDAYFSKRTRTESDLHHVPAFFDHEICGDPRKFMRDLAQAECRDAVLAENVAHLALAPEPVPVPVAADAAAAAVAAANAAAAQAEELDWEATALALHGGSRPLTRPLTRRTSRDQNKETSFRLRALANKLPCRESLHSVGRIAVPNCGRAECIASEDLETRCRTCREALDMVPRCSCRQVDTPFHWFQCQLMDDKRVETLDQITKSWLGQLTSVGAAKHDAALNPAAGVLIDALLGPDLLHLQRLDLGELRADRAAMLAARVAAIPGWVASRHAAVAAGLPIPGEDALPPATTHIPAAAAARLSACAITRGAVHACREFLGSPAAAAAATALHPLPSPRRLAAQLYDAAASLLRSRMWVPYVGLQTIARVQTPHRNARYRRRRTERVRPLAPTRQRRRGEARDQPQGQARAETRQQRRRPRPQQPQLQPQPGNAGDEDEDEDEDEDDDTRRQRCRTCAQQPARHNQDRCRMISLTHGAVLRKTINGPIAQDDASETTIESSRVDL